MDLLKLSDILCKIEDQNVYFRFEPEILDFTDDQQIVDLFFFSSDKQFTVSLSKDSVKDLPFIFEILRHSIFSKGKKVMTWDWKNFASYVMANTQKTFQIDAAIVDLKILESYSGLKSKPPKSLPDALNRLKKLIQSGIWKEIEPVYKKIHIPLMTTVIPHLETVGIGDWKIGKRLFAHYEIDGQENGRLRCFGAFKDNYVPHAMSDDQKKYLRPNNYDEFFMSFDFKGMEVYMLAWMSQDPLLLELCQKKDIYVALFERIFQKSCLDENDRELGKKIFLPVIYGQAAYSLSSRSGLAIDVAEMIIERIYNLFSTALSFVDNHQKQLLEQKFAKDFFCKRRYNFEEGKEYIVRNFSIQSPSSTICLEKLNKLYFALKDLTNIAYTVHDGYVVYVTKKNFKRVRKIGCEVLTSESEICPGLRLRVTCRAGKYLHNLKLLGQED